MKYAKVRPDTGEKIPIQHEEVHDILRPLPNSEAAMQALHDTGRFHLAFFDVIAEEPSPKEQSHEILR